MRCVLHPGSGGVCRPEPDAGPVPPEGQASDRGAEEGVEQAGPHLVRNPQSSAYSTAQGPQTASGESVANPAEAGGCQQALQEGSGATQEASTSAAPVEHACAANISHGTSASRGTEQAAQGIGRYAPGFVNPGTEHFQFQGTTVEGGATYFLIPSANCDASIAADES